LNNYDRTLILCEGETVYLYAKSLVSELPRCLQRSVVVEVFYQYDINPLELVKEAKRRERAAKKDHNSFDNIWIFFENAYPMQIEKALKLISQCNYRAAYVCISIEHWFILHFENCLQEFSTWEEATQCLTGLWPEYRRTGVNVYEKLKDRLDQAIDRAMNINNMQENIIPISGRNPYFTVQELVFFLRQLKQAVA